MVDSYVHMFVRADESMWVCSATARSPKWATHKLLMLYGEHTGPRGPKRDNTAESLTQVRLESSSKMCRLHSSQLWLRLSPSGGVIPTRILATGGCLRRESFTAPDEVANGPNLTLTVTHPPGTSVVVIRHLVSARIAVIKGHGLPSKPWKSTRAGIEHSSRVRKPK